MNLASSGGAAVLAAGALLTLCAACSSAKDDPAGAHDANGGAPAAEADPGNAGHSGKPAGTNTDGVAGSAGDSMANASGGRGGEAGAVAAGASSGAGADPNAGCAQPAPARTVPLDLLILLDASGSMLDLTGGGSSKWDGVKRALEAFLEDSASAGVGVGLQYFPLLKPNAPSSCTSNADCGDSGPCALNICFNSSNAFVCEKEADCVTSTGASAGPCVPLAYCSKNTGYLCANPGSACAAPDSNQDLGTCERAKESVCEHPTSCDVAQYASPAVDIGGLPAAAAGLIASIEGTNPSGDTPTGPALSGALQQATTWATAHPDEHVVTVLITDGLPTECSPTANDALAALAKAGAASSPSVNTFVIGAFGSEDLATTAAENLDQIAQQGGTSHAFIVDTNGDVAAQVRTALESIRSAGSDCQFQLPKAANGSAPDLAKINLILSTATQNQTLQQVNAASNCDPAAGGWYYEVASGTPSQIIACPATCSALRASGATVSIALGCVNRALSH
ncbi:MAG TPA: VWA domain-containing protein [Polyangiaceae bacterium]|nr:VWA domain-containing protein [Polyangiaceae bacterium]